MGLLKSGLMKILPSKMVINIYSIKEIFDAKNIHFSLEGEDIVLNSIFENKKKGFYVDIGANHPKKHSNTYMFYKKGWRGMNVDAAPGSMRLFRIFRSRDINIESPISYKVEDLNYYMFDDPRLNSFSKELSYEREKNTKYKIIKIIKIKTTTLQDIFEKYLPIGIEIDFLTVDVEGYDMNVLKSNDWNKYKPRVIVIEQLPDPNNSIVNSEIYLFLKNKSYNLIAKTGNSCIYSLSLDIKLSQYLTI